MKEKKAKKKTELALSLLFSLSLSFLTGERAMPLDGGVSCLRRSEMIGIGIGELESPPLDSDQVHVLAVDDSLVDRIVIERLLRITSCKGLFVCLLLLLLHFNINKETYLLRLKCSHGG